MNSLAFGILVIIVICAIVYVWRSPKVTQPVSQGTINDEKAKFDTEISNAGGSVEKTQTITSEIAKTETKLNAAETKTIRSEATIARLQTMTCGAPLKTLAQARDYVAGILGVVLVLFVLNPCFGFDTINAEATYKAPVDSIVLTLDELNKFKEKLDAASKTMALVAEYRVLVTDLKEVRAYQSEMINQYKDLEKARLEAMSMYKEAIQTSQTMVDQLRKNNDSLVSQLRNQKRRNVIQRILDMGVGLAIGQGVKKVLKLFIDL